MPSIIYQDINRKISNSFLRVEADNYNGIVECGEFVLIDSDTPYLLGRDLSTSRRLELADPSISYKIPRLGYINIPSVMTCLYVELSTVQQWQKGFNMNAINVTSPWTKDMQLVTGKAIWRWDRIIDKRLLAASVFDRKFYTLEEAVSSIESGERVSCGIDHNIALSVPQSGEEGVLDIYYRLYRVGLYDVKTGAVSLEGHFSSFLENTIKGVLNASR